MPAGRSHHLASWAVAAVFVVAAGCSRDAGPADTGAGPDGIAFVKDGTLTVCSDIPYKPFEYTEENESTEVQGYDAEVVGAIAAANGWQVEWVATPFAGIFDALDGGSCDMIASALPITGDHAGQAEFTRGYFDVANALVVRAVDREALTDLAALAGKTIGVQSGTVSERFVDAHNPGATVKRFPGDTELFAALGEGEVQAVLHDLASSEQHTSEDSSIAMVKVYPTGESLGFAVRAGADPALLDALDTGIGELRADGELERIYRRYFPDAS